jgi:diacylglycerol kinase family enzyme
LALSVAASGQLFTPDGLDELDRCCSEIATMGPEVVVIAGGDGTIMHVLSGLHRAYHAGTPPKLLLLPFGTVNTTIRGWHSDGDPWLLLDQFLADRGSYARRAVLRVDIDRKCFLAATVGAGLVSHFFDEYERVASRGTARALEIFIKVFFGSLVGHAYASKILQAVPGQLTVDGRETGMHELTLLVCSVLKHLGLGLRPTYRAATEPGLIHLVATDLAARRLGPQAWRVLLGKPLVASHLVDQLVTEFALEFAAPTSVILDGERIPARKVMVSGGDDWLVWSPR